MAPLPEILEWYSLTDMVNEFKSPNNFLLSLKFGRSQTLATENIVYRTQSKDRKVSPFVEKGHESIMSGGYSASEVNFTAPNIRIRRPLEACDLLFRRNAGQTIFADGSTQSEAAAAEVALQLQALNDEVANAEEWLAAMAIQGVITYSTPDEASYTINMNKPAGNTIVLATFWDNALATPVTDIMLARRTMHDAIQLNPTVAVLGADAADVFVESQAIRDLLDPRRLDSGPLTITQDIMDSGAMFLGSFMGIDWFAYTRQVEVGGASVDLIRPKYVEFMSVSPQAQDVLYYAGIADLDANDQGTIATKRFSKSWRQPDPSIQQILVSSRPLPIMKRPASVVSMKVVA
jgi:hypothetical protein